MYLATVDWAISIPNIISPPWSRGASHSGFSRLTFRTSSRMSRSIFGRPPTERDFQRQHARNPRRCHRITVSGLTITIASKRDGKSRDKQTKIKRSMFRSRTRARDLLRAITCWRRRMFSASSPTRDNNASGISVELARVLGSPLGRRVTILRSCWKFVLRREPVIDRNHHASRGAAKVAANAIVRVETAEHKTATVKKHHQRERPVAIGRVDAYRQIATWDTTIQHRSDR
jgi:hypothetical protein